MMTEQVSIPIEEWRPVQGYKNLYSVSNLGRIKRNKGYRRKSDYIRKTVIDACGYPRVNLCCYGIKRCIFVHTIVVEAFIGSVIKPQQVNHKNGIKTDNRVENLEICSPSENLFHSYRELGRYVAHGEVHVNAKLCDSKARTIRQMFAAGFRIIDIVRYFKMPRGTIDAVIKRRSWNHVV